MVGYQVKRQQDGERLPWATQGMASTELTSNPVGTKAQRLLDPASRAPQPGPGHQTKAQKHKDVWDPQGGGPQHSRGGNGGDQL